jgi:hypothetical protein
MKKNAVTLVINFPFGHVEHSRPAGEFLTPFIGQTNLVIQCVRCGQLYSTPVCGCVIAAQRLKVAAMQHELQANLLRPRLA